MGTTAAELKLCTIQGIVRLCPPWHKGHRHTGHTGEMKAALTHTYTHNDTGSGTTDRQGQEEGAAA